MGRGLGLERGAVEVPGVAVLVLEGRACRRRKIPDSAVVAVRALEPQLRLLQLATLGDLNEPLQYPPLGRHARLVCAIVAHFSSAKRADSILAHEGSAERWKRIWVGLRIGGALMARMTETALAIDALDLCPVEK